MDADRERRQEIDNMILGLLGMVEEYQRVREASGQLAKQAYFDLTLARRSAGYRWISADLYSGRAQAVATTTIDSETGELSGAVERRPTQRTEKGKTVDDDPVLWFGMLVPPKLKDAQSGFVAMLDQLAHLAQLRQRIARQQQRVQSALDQIESTI
ncbi:hypothetical protein LPJ53_001234 [Coemansia erecta]|uniref:Vacuolar ATPase assembly protein VMA22 n=1 Tax=Coemansia erecta TaxID=147472 RepID=A0A9W7Y0H1_9FUNG|nr:hypothetical protein LPJ53_001234 [Coemansia erecta]